MREFKDFGWVSENGASIRNLTRLEEKCRD